jgi:hypothetical protein
MSSDKNQGGARAPPLEKKMPGEGYRAKQLFAGSKIGSAGEGIPFKKFLATPLMKMRRLRIISKETQYHLKVFLLLVYHTYRMSSLTSLKKIAIVGSGNWGTAM